jgi:hypothetical protein
MYAIYTIYTIYTEILCIVPFRLEVPTGCYINEKITVFSVAHKSVLARAAED